MDFQDMREQICANVLIAYEFVDFPQRPMLSDLPVPRLCREKLEIITTLQDQPTEDDMSCESHKYVAFVVSTSDPNTLPYTVAQGRPAHTMIRAIEMLLHTTAEMLSNCYKENVLLSLEQNYDGNVVQVKHGIYRV